MQKVVHPGRISGNQSLPGDVCDYAVAGTDHEYSERMNKKVIITILFIAKSSLTDAMTEIECICFLGCEAEMIQATYSAISEMPIERYTTVYVFDHADCYEGAFNTNSIGFDNPELEEYNGYYCKYFDSEMHSFQICCYYDETG